MGVGLKASTERVARWRTTRARSLRRLGRVGSMVEIVLTGLFAATLVMAAATVISRVVHQARGTGYP